MGTSCQQGIGRDAPAAPNSMRKNMACRRDQAIASSGRAGPPRGTSQLHGHVPHLGILPWRSPSESRGCGAQSSAATRRKATCTFPPGKATQLIVLVVVLTHRSLRRQPVVWWQPAPTSGREQAFGLTWATPLKLPYHLGDRGSYARRYAVPRYRTTAYGGFNDLSTFRLPTDLGWDAQGSFGSVFLM